jgi:hypothetical protein
MELPASPVFRLFRPYNRNAQLIIVSLLLTGSLVYVCLQPKQIVSWIIFGFTLLNLIFVLTQTNRPVQPVIEISLDGISAQAWRGFTLPWKNIANANVHVYGGTVAIEGPAPAPTDKRIQPFLLQMRGYFQYLLPVRYAAMTPQQVANFINAMKRAGFDERADLLREAQAAFPPTK